MSHESIIKKFEEKLGDTDFVLPGQLVTCGMYGSSTAVRHALDKGVLPSVRVSSHRTLIPKDAVLDHLRKSLTVSG